MEVITKTAESTTYKINDKLHRTDGPAIECKNGDKYYYLDGKRHRTDGPAMECNNNKEYYLDGVKVEPFKTKDDIIAEIHGILIELANRKR